MIFIAIVVLLILILLFLLWREYQLDFEATRMMYRRKEAETVASMYILAAESGSEEIVKVVHSTVREMYKGE